ncbi:MAG: energy-coupling factor transporter ATPase [Clostridia bacterium]|nr:energy-coupling factor transporter ATPase [Clostridia bacterium]
MSIKVENLKYVYSKKTPFEKVALDGVTMEIEDGDFFGIIGHTGSGKSTLVTHFNALTRVQSGKIYLGETDLTPKKIDFKKVRSTVGMVFQYPEYQLFDKTVEDDVAFGCKNLGLSKEECSQRARQAIELVGLDYEEIKDRSPFELSGGQKRRVALAGVLSMRPEILVLDEPTAGLDPRGKREIMELIVSIRESCPTTVMISHNMDEVAGFCNKVAVMAEGKLYGVFSPSELFSQKELLETLGLAMPKITALAEKLRERGFDIARGIVRPEVLVSEVERVLSS